MGLLSMEGGPDCAEPPFVPSLIKSVDRAVDFAEEPLR
jgi:hypothetical protein